MITGAQLLHDIYVNTDIEPLEYDADWRTDWVLEGSPALIAGKRALALNHDQPDDDGRMIFVWTEYVCGYHGRDDQWEEIGSGPCAGTEPEAREAFERWLRDV